MPGQNAALATAVQHRVNGNDPILLENAHFAKRF